MLRFLQYNPETGKYENSLPPEFLPQGAVELLRLSFHDASHWGIELEGSLIPRGKHVHVNFGETVYKSGEQELPKEEWENLRDESFRTFGCDSDSEDEEIRNVEISPEKGLITMVDVIFMLGRMAGMSDEQIQKELNEGNNGQKT